jgi:plasmid maintenance system antidote protein VapI
MAKKAKNAKRETVTDQIRRHVRECGLTCYALSKLAAIDEATLSRFLSGERGISAKALDRLGAVLNFEVVCHGPNV